jgi:signal transduction histidine kinase
MMNLNFNTKKQKILVYAQYISIGVSIVVLSVFISSRFIAGVSYSLPSYVLPALVGAFFGVWMARTYLLEKKYEQESKIEAEKTQKISSNIGAIVHDLRSPVANISGLSELMLNNVLSRDKDQYLYMIKNTSDAMMENIATLMDMSRIENGPFFSSLEKGNPYPIIHASIERFIGIASYKNISIRENLVEEMPAVLYDRNALDRVVSNLVSNAIKYSPANTEIAISFKRSPGKLELIVKDQGLGMTQEDLQNVFGEYQRLSATPTGGESSIGLGLSITKKLVKEMGGEVSVLSEGKNKGSEFHFTLQMS